MATDRRFTSLPAGPTRKLAVADREEAIAFFRETTRYSAALAQR